MNNKIAIVTGSSSGFGLLSAVGAGMCRFYCDSRYEKSEEV